MKISNFFGGTKVSFDEAWEFIVKVGVAAHQYGSTSTRVEYFLSGLADKLGYQGVFKSTPTEITFALRETPNAVQRIEIMPLPTPNTDLDKLARLGDLLKEIEEGNFREDLYHRLAVILIDVPALNNRREDIPLLIDHFTEKIAQEQGNVKKLFSDKAIKKLQEYDWTGNIRELRNVVERLIILGGKEVSEEDVQLFASK